MRSFSSISSLNMLDKNIDPCKELVIVTGLSGAGKTGVVRVLEDLDYYCIDNLPVPMIRHFIECIAMEHDLSKVAFGIDIRGKDFFSTFLYEIEQIKKMAWKVTIIFLDAHDKTLLKRYQETRRRHPLQQDITLSEAISYERKLLDPILQEADLHMNTDSWNVHDLRKWARSYFNASIAPDLLVNFVSFGFKHGTPLESNALYDLRSLPNPYFVPDLRSMSGKDIQVYEYLFHNREIQEYWDKFITFLEFSLKKTYEEGRFSATIAIGCTGGRHRSVAFVERLAKHKFSQVKSIIYHRDIEKS
ncbi:RNase adapter RapZ [Candidatus Babeliales bacterium]|nr:RNase adapter RapZ [Candidatus Babeliales bacterium]